METTTATAITPGEMPLLSSARRNLRQVLNHPAFSKERREKAEALISANTNAAQLLQWKLLALRESEAWEDAQLAREAAQLAREAQELGPAAHPAYTY